MNNVQYANKKRLRAEFIGELERAQATQDYKSMSEIYTEIEALDGLDKHYIEQFFVEYSGGNRLILPRECVNYLNTTEVVCQIQRENCFTIEPYNRYFSAEEYELTGCRRAYIRRLTDTRALILDNDFKRILEIRPGALLTLELFDGWIFGTVYEPLLV